MWANRFLIGLLIAFVLQASIGYWLYDWMMDDFRPTTIFRMQLNPEKERRRLDELQRKPWRPWARLGMFSTLLVGALVIDVYLLRQVGPLADD